MKRMSILHFGFLIKKTYALNRNLPPCFSRCWHRQRLRPETKHYRERSLGIRVDWRSSSVPDGSRVAFVHVTVNEKKEGYNTSIWSVPTAGGEEPHQLTKGDHDSTPRWSPDGKYLLFLRATEVVSRRPLRLA